MLGRLRWGLEGWDCSKILQQEITAKWFLTILINFFYTLYKLTQTTQIASIFYNKSQTRVFSLTDLLSLSNSKTFNPNLSTNVLPAQIFHTIILKARPSITLKS
jgi:hypothetical protein